MSDRNIPDSGEPETAGYEKRDINPVKVFLFGMAGVVVIVVLVIFMVNYFTATREELVYEAVLKPESTALRELRAREEEELNTYAVLDAKKGIYRIPIKRAMELMAEEAYQARLEAGGKNTR
jgi:hypothetical protein